MYRRWRYIVVKAGDAPGVISIIRFTTFFAPLLLLLLFLFVDQTIERRVDEGEEKLGG